MKNEKGQALPLAIIALVIGALLVTPFLSHAGTNLIGSRVYAGEIGSRSASDAGVEHAIWSLTGGTLAAEIPNTGDQTTYQLDEELNGVTTTVTVTTNATGSGDIPGTINNTIIDTHDFDKTSCNTPRIIHVSGNIYAIAYEGASSDGFLATMEVAPDGAINATVIDILEFDPADCAKPDIIHVSGNIYAIAYTGTQSDGFVKTMTIDTAGNIGNTVIDTLEFDPSNGVEPDIIFVTGNHYAIAYSGQQNDGFLKTITIDAAGNIGDTVIDTLEFDPSNCNYPDIEHIAGSVFGIAYQGVGNDGFLVTVSIAANGDIANTIIDTLEFDPSDCANPDIIQISGNVYGIAYDSTGNDGFLTTMTVSNAGDISSATISTFEFDPVNGQEPKIIYITSNIYAIAYNGPQNDGYLITLPIETSGFIPGTIIDTLEYDTSNGYFPSMLLVSDGVLAVAYCAPAQKGSLVTIGINTQSGTAAASYEIVSTAGDITIQALVNIEDTTVSIAFWKIE